MFFLYHFLLLLQRDIWQRILHPLKTVGRTALTNYLLQTVVCTLIFYSYGFGMYGKLGPALGVVLAFIIFGIQTSPSNLWLKYFKFGPILLLLTCSIQQKILSDENKKPYLAAPFFMRESIPHFQDDGLITVVFIFVQNL